MQPSGAVRLVTTAADIGQGLDTVLAQLVAEELRMPYEAIEVSTRDTEDSPDGGFTCASRQTYNTGNAAVEAARRLKESVAAAAAEMLGRDGRTGDDRRRRSAGAGRFVVAAELRRPRQGGSPATVLRRLRSRRRRPRRQGQGRPYETYTFGTQVVEVEVHVTPGR